MSAQILENKDTGKSFEERFATCIKSQTPWKVSRSKLLPSILITSNEDGQNDKDGCQSYAHSLPPLSSLGSSLKESEKARDTGTKVAMNLQKSPSAESSSRTNDNQRHENRSLRTKIEKENDEDDDDTSQESIDSNVEIRDGRWGADEHARFLVGFERHGSSWRKVQQVVKTRTVTQVRTHAQKYLQKISRQDGPKVLAENLASTPKRSPTKLFKQDSLRKMSTDSAASTNSSKDDASKPSKQGCRSSYGSEDSAIDVSERMERIKEGKGDNFHSNLISESIEDKRAIHAAAYALYSLMISGGGLVSQNKFTVEVGSETNSAESLTSAPKSAKIKWRQIGNDGSGQYNESSTQPLPLTATNVKWRSMSMESTGSYKTQPSKTTGETDLSQISPIAKVRGSSPEDSTFTEHRELSLPSLKRPPTSLLQKKVSSSTDNVDAMEAESCNIVSSSKPSNGSGIVSYEKKERKSPSHSSSLKRKRSASDDESSAEVKLSVPLTKLVGKRIMRRHTDGRWCSGVVDKMDSESILIAYDKETNDNLALDYETVSYNDALENIAVASNEVVSAKLQDQPWWPARRYRMLQTSNETDLVFVEFFGDHTIAWLQRANCKKFDPDSFVGKGPFLEEAAIEAQEFLDNQVE